MILTILCFSVYPSSLCRKMFLEISFPLVGAFPNIFWAPSQWSHLDGGRVADILKSLGGR